MANGVTFTSSTLALAAVGTLIPPLPPSIDTPFKAPIASADSKGQKARPMTSQAARAPANQLRRCVQALLETDAICVLFAGSSNSKPTGQLTNFVCITGISLQNSARYKVVASPLCILYTHCLILGLWWWGICAGYRQRLGEECLWWGDILVDAPALGTRFRSL